MANSKRTQVIETEFNKVCSDSGAGESVCPIEASPHLEMHDTGKVGKRYMAAGGQVFVNEGEKMPQLTTNGVNTYGLPTEYRGQEAPSCRVSNYSERKSLCARQQELREPDREQEDGHQDPRQARKRGVHAGDICR